MSRSFKTLWFDQFSLLEVSSHRAVWAAPFCVVALQACHAGGHSQVPPCPPNIFLEFLPLYCIWSCFLDPMSTLFWFICPFLVNHILLIKGHRGDTCLRHCLAEFVPLCLMNSSVGIKVQVENNFPLESLKAFVSFSSSFQGHGSESDVILILDTLWNFFSSLSGSFWDLLFVPNVL